MECYLHTFCREILIYTLFSRKILIYALFVVRKVFARKILLSGKLLTFLPLPVMHASYLPKYLTYKMILKSKFLAECG